MLTLDRIKLKYSNLIEDNPSFLGIVDEVKSKIDFSKLSATSPLLVYSRNNKNAIYFVLCTYLSFMSDKLLDYVITTGQIYVDHHFMTSDKNFFLYYNIQHSDITIIALSQFDYTSEYLESLLIDLVENRKLRNKLTIIYYDTIDNNYSKQTKKLHDFFNNNNYTVLNMTSTNQTTNKVDNVRKSSPRGRIV